MKKFLGRVLRFQILILLVFASRAVAEWGPPEQDPNLNPNAEQFNFLDEKDKEEETSISEFRYDCQSAREYITAYKYLREKSKEMGLEDEMTKRAADKIARGCTGAAQRFIKAFNVLVKAEVGARTSMQLAMRLAKKDDIYAKVFVEIFKRAYLKEYLDLDMHNSLKIAEALSLNYEGKVDRALDDFVKVTDFCMGEKKMNLSLPFCARLASRLAKKGAKFPTGISAAFMDLVSFARTEMNLAVHDAIKISENIVSVSPTAAENFKLAFKFGTSDLGLGLTNKEALFFAKKIAVYTKQKWTPLAFEEQQRLPAATPKK